MSINSTVISSLFKLIPLTTDQHSPTSALHEYCRLTLSNEIEKQFKDNDSIDFGPFGKLKFPYRSMGNINSLNLFELDEMIMFIFYWQHREKYKKVLDIGANIGLHTILLAKCGYQVHSFEPEKNHHNIIQENLKLNNVSNVNTHNVAVSDKEGEAEFIVVKGNTTGSHIAGSKANPYGDLETYKVPLLAFDKLTDDVDFVKMDVEGHEKDIICGTNPNVFRNLDLMLSVHDEDNARAVFEYFTKHNINIFSQKTNWGKVDRYEDMTITHHDGSLFITTQENMDWS
jgi:FkbM family methyltransferase